MNLPDGFARCPHCLASQVLYGKQVYGVTEKECDVCGADLRLRSASDIRERNPVGWLHGKEQLIENQKRYGYAIAEYLSQPKYGFQVTSVRINGPRPQTIAQRNTVLSNWDLFADKAP